MGAVLKTLHLVRRANDDLAWRAIALSLDTGEAKVVLLSDAAGEVPSVAVETMSCPPVEYDEIVTMIAWADKVVVW